MGEEYAARGAKVPGPLANILNFQFFPMGGTRSHIRSHNRTAVVCHQHGATIRPSCDG